MGDLPEGFWDDLLDYIQEGTVIPVLGSELVTVREGERDVPLPRWLAARLVADLELPEDELPPAFDLNDVVSLHLRRRGEREELYPRINRILRREALPPSEPLLALAGISGFELFVSLTFDSLLADAVGAARLGGGRAEQVVYSPNAVRDLPRPKDQLGQPVVFHLFGRASASPDYAVCDDDLLEFLHALQDKQRQPKLLFDELRSHHLLILGCRYGDWLARFFLRTARNLELSQRRRRREMLVGEHLEADGGLVLFLESYSSDTQVVKLTAAGFVAELARRWHAAHPPGTEAQPSKAQESVPSVPAGAIFLSYAREDGEAAARVAEGLRAAGLEVWFDRKDLEPGDAWKRRIRQAIAGCSLFLPVISRQTLGEENRRRFFWREWMEADDLARGMAPDEVFLVPVAIDDTPLNHSSLPDSFFEKPHGVTLVDGGITPEFVHRLTELVKAFHRRRRAA